MESSEKFDLVVLGGGINGAGIARDAAGRGISVLLCEQDDLAQHTSSASTKLIHGGLRYLEYGEFGLVRKALVERRVLMELAPHLIRPLRFILPYAAPAVGAARLWTRPAWMIRAGLLLYDGLAWGDPLPKSEAIDLRNHPAGLPLRQDFVKGFAYSDASVDDARLVISNAVDARERGASVATRTRCTDASRGPHSWTLRLVEADSGAEHVVETKSLVNATGPWVGQVLAGLIKVESRHRIRLDKGSHIVVGKLFDHACAYILQNPDRRIVFAIPYEREFTLIGTTEADIRDLDGAAALAVNAAETQYLCESVNRYFRTQIRPQEVVHSYWGVRPLLNDDAGNPAAVTRDYSLELNTDAAPVLSVFGGKITTYRKLAEDAVDMLTPLVGIAAKQKKGWTGKAALPGGEIAGGDLESLASNFRSRYPWLPRSLADRLVHAYGSRVEEVLDHAGSSKDLGEEIAPGLHARELIYLRDREWARTEEDVLWRRTKLGLHYSPRDREAVSDWMKKNSALKL